MTRTASTQIVDCFQRVVTSSPASPALTAPSGGRFATWTYEELDAARLSMLEALRACSSSHSVVGIPMRPDHHSVAALLAAVTAGQPALLIPPGSSPAETDWMQHQVRAAVTFDHERGRHGGWRPGHHQPVPDAGKELSLGEDLFVVQLTSGSTRASRLAARTRVGVVLEIQTVVDALHVGRKDRVLCASSPSHSYGLMGGLLGALVSGAHATLAPDPGRAAHMVREVLPTVIFGLPATYRVLLTLPEVAGGLRSSRICLSAGAPLHHSVYRDAEKVLGIDIRQDYGTTETGTISMDLDRTATPGTVGTPLPHLGFRLRATDGGSEVEVRGPSVASGYVVDGRVQPVSEDGWYRTEDLGELDGSGRLRLLGRVLPPLLVDGRTLRPEAVEEMVSQHPGVRDVGAIACPAQGGRKAVLRVVVAPALDVKELSAWYRVRSPLTAEVIVFESRAELPRSPAGKLLRKYLL